MLMYALLVLIPFLTLAGTAAAGIDAVFDFIGEFKVQGAVLSVLLMLFSLYKRQTAAAGLFLFFALMNWALIASHYHFTPPKTAYPDENPVFTLLYQDLKGADRRYDDVRLLLERYDADIVLLTDVPVKIYERLNDIKGGYVLQNQSYDTTGKMMLVLSKPFGMSRGAVTKAGIWVSHVFSGRRLTIVLTSLGDVWNGDYESAAKKTAELAQFAKDRDEPVLLTGDLKASNWSSVTKPLKSVGNLEIKEPLFLSYPTSLPSFLRRPAASVYAHTGVELVDWTPVNALDSTVSGFFTAVKMAPAQKKVVFYDLPDVTED